MMGPEIEDAVDRIEAQGVDVIFLEPIHGVLAKKSSHFVAALTIEIDRLTPRSSVTIRKVRTVCIKVVALRTEMVVDHIERYSEALSMRGIDETLQRCRPTVAALRREWIGAVISPIARPGELGHRHDLHRGDTKVHKFRKMRDQGIEGTFRRVYTYMQFVEDAGFQRTAFPSLIGPLEGGGVEELRWPMHTFRLKAG